MFCFCIFWRTAHTGEKSTGENRASGEFPGVFPEIRFSPVTSLFPRQVYRREFPGGLPETRIDISDPYRILPWPVTASRLYGSPKLLDQIAVQSLELHDEWVR